MLGSKLKQRISVLDRSREVIGLTLKKLNASYNLADLSRASDLNLKLAKLHQQVKFYSADNYLQPLVMGDTWVAVGWSSDTIDLLEKNPNIGAIVPTSGTAMFADLWVQPALSSKLTSAERLAATNDNKTKLNRQWLDYCLQPKTSEQISIFTNATAPLLTSLTAGEISPDLQNRALVLPPKNILDKSEFIYPLSSKSKAQYDKLWREIRNTKVNH